MFGESPVLSGRAGLVDDVPDTEVTSSGASEEEDKLSVDMVQNIIGQIF